MAFLPLLAVRVSPLIRRFRSVNQDRSESAPSLGSDVHCVVGQQSSVKDMAPMLAYMADTWVPLVVDWSDGAISCMLRASGDRWNATW